jgi:membrane associated rhomboid family serine protease
MSQYYYSREQQGFGSSRITWAVQRLILANIALFTFQLFCDPIDTFLQGPQFPKLSLELSTWFGFQPDLFFRGMVWKPFSYQFLHSGLMHLFMNMLWLFFFGPDVERTLGTRQFFRFYILCGAVGVLATLIPYFIDHNRSPSVIGASGAVMGVMVAFALIDPERQFFLFPLPFPINARMLVLIVVVFQVITARTGGNNVSVATHFGGMAVGLVYMKLVPLYTGWQRRRKRRPQKPKEKKGEPHDKMGEAIDNIFNFKDKNRH